MRRPGLSSDLSEAAPDMDIRGFHWRGSEIHAYVHLFALLTQPQLHARDTHSHTAVCQLDELHLKFYRGLAKVALQLLCFTVSTFLYGGRRQDSQRAVSCFIKDLSISNYRVTTVWLRDRKLERKKSAVKKMWARGSQGQGTCECGESKGKWRWKKLNVTEGREPRGEREGNWKDGNPTFKSFRSHSSEIN